MSAALKQKGPAEVAASPSHVSTNPLEGMTNMETHTTAPAGAPDFPIPYANQTPVSDLLSAVSLLSMIDTYLDDGSMHGLSKEDVQHIVVPFSMVLETIHTLVDFLNADERPGTLVLYQQVRRERILDSFARGRA